MSQAYIGQIQPFAFNFAPRHWAQCNGQIMPIAQNTALFSLLGTMYGGDGRTTFALPDLRGRVPMHAGTSPFDTYSQGEEAGEETVTLDISTMPAHNHLFLGSSADADKPAPSVGAVLAKIDQTNGDGDPYYGPDTKVQPLNPASLTMTGGNQFHPNLQPYLTINWCICTAGVFPSRN